MEDSVYVRIDARCRECGTNITALEKELGFSLGTISHWKKSSPKSDNLLMVANKLECSVDYLLTGKKIPATENGDGEESERDIQRKEINRLLDAAPEWLQNQIHSLLKAEESDRTSQGDGPKAP